MNIAINCPVCLSDLLKKKPAILMPFIAKRIFDWEPVVINDEDNFKTLDSGKSYSVCNSVYCENCKLLFLDMRFNDEEMNNLYRDYRNDVYINLRELFEKGYAERNNILSKQIHYMNLIEEFISINCDSSFHNLLDWGGESGINTPFLKKMSVKKYIYDISKNKINNDIVYLESIDNKKFDLITCIHVFEHVPYPLKALKELILNLNDNGHIYIEVPKESIIDDKLLDVKILNNKKHWHEHINFYSIKSLSELIKNAGLTLIDISSSDVTKDQFHLSIYQLIAKKLKK